MMKLSTVIPYLKKIQIIYESREAPLEFCLCQHFFTENQQILLYQEIQIQIAFWYIISNSFKFYWVLKIVLINMVTVLMMSAKMTTPGLRIIKVLWKKGYDVMISVNDVTNKTLLRDSSYIVDVVMWTKFGNSSISTSEFIIISSL